MYSITIKIKHKEVYDKLLQEVQLGIEQVKKDPENDGKDNPLENIQYGETESSAEINLTAEELFEDETEESVEYHQES